MSLTACAIAWQKILAHNRLPCYAFAFDCALVHFKLRLTENGGIETSHKVCYAFCVINKSACGRPGGLSH